MKRRWIWTLAVAALFCSCSVSEDLEMEVPSADDCILEVAVGLGDGGKTRGLSGDASSITATWEAGDKVLVYKGSTKVGELTPVSTGSASTTLRGKLSGTYDSYAAGSTLTLYYNTTSTSFSSFTQDGTLATILANLRYQSATTTVSKASDRPTLTGTAVTFNLAANNPSINHFTLSKEMKTLRVCVKGSSSILVSATAASPTTDFYVAIPAAASKTYYIEGVDSRLSEYFQAKTAALSANKYYSASITLAEYPLTFEPVSATTTVTIPNSESLTYEYSLNDGASWTSSSAASVAMNVSAGQRLMVRRQTGNYPNDYIGTITISQPCYVYGNVHSLFGFRNKLSGSKFYYRELFLNQENLISHGYRNICIVPIVDGVKNMSNMFRSMFDGCSNLTTPPVLDFSMFGQVTNTNSMFYRMFFGCSNLTTAPVLDLSDFDTSSVIDMTYMFSLMFDGCSSLMTAPVLDLSNWNTSSVTEMYNMFDSMFARCSSLMTAPVLDLSNFDTSSVLDMNNMFSGMFSGCTSLMTAPVLDLSHWDTSQVEEMGAMFERMFSGCGSLTTAPDLNFSNWNTPDVTQMNVMFAGMFVGCSSLTTVPDLDLSHFDTSKVKSMIYMFSDMFSGCTSLTTAPVLDLLNWDTSKVRDMEGMFYGMFSGCTSLTTAPVLDLLCFDTTQVENMEGMFYGMFYECTSLNAVKMKLTDATILGDTSGFEDFLTDAKDTGTLTVSSGTTSYWNAIKTAGYIPSGWSIMEQ